MKTKMQQRIIPAAQEMIFLAAAFLLWLSLKFNYWAGDWPWGAEATQLNQYAKSFLLSLSFGEYPLWDPFHFWGCQDDYAILNYGHLNPFLYLVLLLYKLGCPFTSAFLVYTIVYYGFGLLGFYWLAKVILQDDMFALGAYLLMLFSSLGIGWDMQSNIFLAVAPIPWLFYSLLQLIKTQERRYILGATFFFALVMTTYVPGYFMLTATAFILACVLFCFGQLQSACGRLCQAVVKHKWAVIVCLITVAVALTPRVIWYFAVQDQQYVFNVRSHASGLKHNAAVDIEGAKLSGVATEYTVPELFTDLDIGTVQFYYISIFVYLLILMSFRNKANAARKVLFFMICFIFIYILADVTPFHDLAFYLIPFAAYMRNYCFIGSLWAFLLVLFALEQLKDIWDINLTDRKMWIGWMGYLVLVHGGFLVYLRQEDCVMGSSYAAVVLSFLAFTLRWSASGKPHAQKVALILLFMAMLIQPLEVNFNFAHRQFATPESPQLARYDRPKFSYTRPREDARYLTWGFGDLAKELQDVSGYAGDYYFGVKWSYALNRQVFQPIFSSYTQFKFFLFDQVTYVDESAFDMKQLENSLCKHENMAYVFAPPIKDVVVPAGVPEKAQVIRGESANFKVLDFRLNFIRVMTDLPAPKFLVYNDSYHSSWRAFINGAPVTLYRANMAFKGVWLPAGKNIVEFRYGPVWLPWFYTGIVVYFLLFSLLTLRIFLKAWRRKGRGDHEKYS